MGPLTFMSPALLAGTALVAVPILVHLWLRPRPRRVSFPALALLRPALLSGRRASRVRNLWLLLLRCLLIAGAAFLLAGPTCRQADDSARTAGPVGTVLIIDDSLSTLHPAEDGEPLARHIHDRAERHARDAVELPRGSALAVVFADRHRGDLGLADDPGRILAALRSSRAADEHAMPLGDAIDRAATILRAAPQGRREIVVFTDGAVHAWRGVTPSQLEGLEDAAVRVFISGASRPTNLALARLELLDTQPRAGTRLAIRAELHSTGVGVDARLATNVDGVELARDQSLRVDVGRTREVELMLPPVSVGLHRLRCVVEPDDYLDFDQTRYLAVDVRPRPVVGLVSHADARTDDLHALILRNLLAPAALPDEQQLVELREVSRDDLAALLDDREGRPSLVILPGSVANDADVEPLVELARGGTMLLLAADAGGAPAGLWKQLTAAPLPVEDAPGDDRLLWSSDLPWASSDELREMSRCAVHRRLSIASLLPEVTVEARFADGSPAVVGRRIGKGRLLALLTNVTPSWSDLGIRAGGLLAWLHALIDESAPVSSNVANLTAHDVSRQRFPALVGEQRVAVRCLGDAESSAVWLSVRDGQPETCWPTDRAGLYSIRTAAGEERALYAVNWPSAESRLDFITLDALRDAVGVSKLHIETESESAGTSGRWWGRWLSLPGVVGMVLVLLLLGEAVVAGAGSDSDRAPPVHDGGTKK